MADTRTPKRGATPSPRSSLAAATPHVPHKVVPPNFIIVPPRISSWGNFSHGDCVTAEEAFAKACHDPEIFITDDVAIGWATEHGVLETANIVQVMSRMQSDGFIQGPFIFNDGLFLSVNWTDPATLHSAIADGPVKLGVAAGQLENVWHSTSGNTGWFATGFVGDDNQDHSVTLCGYGTFTFLAQKLKVSVPAGIDGTTQGYALFTWDSIGIIDHASMVAITQEAWLRQPTTIRELGPGFCRPVFRQGDPGNGIGGYDLKSPADRAFAFDFDHSGKLDHLALYRPGAGTIWILKNNGGAFSPVFHQGDPGNGIGGYDLKSPADRAFAFDFDHSGKLDHLALYRPGTGTIWILKNSGGTFSPVFHQGDPGNGIGGYDLKSPADQVFAVDFDHSGKLDHLALYRPGTGTIWILKNSGGTFSPVFHQGDPGNGIGGYDLKSPADRAFAFDFDHSGKLDHLALYRPGTGTIWILKNSGGTFSLVFRQGDPGNGIGGYDLKSHADRVFAFDFDHSGKLDHLALYRPGTGTIWILKNSDGNFSRVYHQGDPGRGIGGYDLRSPADQAFAFDFDHSGKPDHLALYRPGTGTMWIEKNVMPLS